MPVASVSQRRPGAGAADMTQGTTGPRGVACLARSGRGAQDGAGGIRRDGLHGGASATAELLARGGARVGGSGGVTASEGAKGPKMAEGDGAGGGGGGGEVGVAPSEGQVRSNEAANGANGANGQQTLYSVAEKLKLWPSWRQ